MIRVFLAILLFAFAAASPAVAEERHALLIGNKAYDAKLGALQNPLNDIAVVGQALEKLSFRITRVPDADYRAVDTAIKRHVQAVRRAGPGAISFVYYSGHGAADPETKINYLIPIDVKSTDSDEVWTFLGCTEMPYFAVMS